MSHQTGIQADAELLKFYSKCKDGKTRIIKIVIENEQLHLAKNFSKSGTWKVDYEKYVPTLVEEDQPCYILLRLDTKNSLGHEWLLISWSPDTAPIRQKMLYASTKATLKREFGTSHIKDEFHATTKEEVSLRGYEAHLRNESAPAPLTQREEEMKYLQATETNTNYSVDSRQSTVGGVAFPITEATKQGLHDFLRGSYNYLQFKINLDEEHIDLAKAANVSLVELPEQVPSDQARYHLYLFKHSHEGDSLKSIVFVYSMPGYTCAIKERMLYSSCKGQFLEFIEQNGAQITKKLEIDDGKELTEQYLYDEIHPTVNLHRPAFAKPRGPPNRGPKRITKSQTAQ